MIIVPYLDVHAGDGSVLSMSNISDLVTAVALCNIVIIVTQLFTCIAKAFRATEIGPFSASQAAISEEKNLSI